MTRTLEALLFVGALAQPVAPLTETEALAAIGSAEVTVADMDAAYWRLPQEVRTRWVNDPRLIGNEMTEVLLKRALARDALAGAEPGLEDPAGLARVAEDERLAELWLQLRALQLAAPVNETDVAAYYEGNPAEFVTPETRAVRHLFVSTRYQSETRAREEIESLAASVVAGEATFGALFDRYAALVGEGARGAVKIDALRAGQDNVDPAFAAAAMALMEPGAISEPVQTSFGFHLIELDRITPERTIPLAQVAAAIQARLGAERLDAARKLLLDQLDDEAGSPLESLARRLRAHPFSALPRVAAMTRQAGEFALFRAVREKVNAAAAAAASSLARERFLSRRESYDRPATVSYWTVSVPTTALDDAEIDALASAFAADEGTRATDVRDFAYDAFFGRIDYEPTRGSVPLKEIAPALRGALGDETLSELPARIALELDGRLVLMEVIAYDPGQRMRFEEVEDRVLEDVGGSVAQQRWRLFMSRYHQIPLQAEPERIGMLQQRYAEGVPMIDAPALLMP